MIRVCVFVISVSQGTRLGEWSGTVRSCCCLQRSQPYGVSALNRAILALPIAMVLQLVLGVPSPIRKFVQDAAKILNVTWYL